MTSPRASLAPADFVALLREVLPATDAAGAAAAYPLHEPSLGPDETAAVVACLQSTFVSSVGAYVDQLERDLERLTGAARAVVVVNGTAALEVSLLLAGVERGDLVVTPSLTFVATANAIRHAGAEPAFVDVEEETLGLSPADLRRFFEETCVREGGGWRHAATGRRVGAVVLVHIFGNPARAVEVQALCQELGVPLVEDAAESLASFVGDTHTGRFGVAGALSFNGNKIVTTGGGGAVLTDDEALGAHAKHLTTTAKRPHRWEYWHTDVGYNYRMPNLNAALGVAQVGRLDELLAKKVRLFDRWCAVFDGSDVEVLRPRAGTRSNHWLNAVRLPVGTSMETRNAWLDAACDEKIFCRPLWVPMHRLPMYAACPRGALPVTESSEARIICLPSSAHLDRGGA